MTANDATKAQTTAAHPETSTWLSANAGSGKTRVLTDRVARLLLNRVDPQNILCLTYTKAAASEMQNRLFKRLGAWSMATDDELINDLITLGEGRQLAPERLALARQLFARAIETPGGLRIQTIHSFCAGLLRRYPLEARVTPGFQEMDERSTSQLRGTILQNMATGPEKQVFQELSFLPLKGDMESLLAEICQHVDYFSQPPNKEKEFIRFGLSLKESEEKIRADTFTGGEAALLKRLSKILAEINNNVSGHILKISSLNIEKGGIETLSILEGMFLTGADSKKNPPYTAKIDTYANIKVRDALGKFLPDLHDLMKRIEAARPRRIALMAARQNLILHRFAHSFITLYTQHKARRGVLDFDDLINCTIRLLKDPSVAAWVLYRLDGGIDHILVDEAQDTSPKQWEIIERLTEEFTAERGVRKNPPPKAMTKNPHAEDMPLGRTLFVVGDKKQSIYSFQGADLKTFDGKRNFFRTQLENAHMPITHLSLDHSFRSSPAILDVVDATFSTAFPKAIGEAPHHLAFFEALPGRVELWPLTPKASKSDEEDGLNPVDLIFEDHHNVTLARQIAIRIHEIITQKTQIIERGAPLPRPIHAGDFLILVQRRAALFDQIIRACKREGLPVAGADRLKLNEELAVKDVLALLAFLATPEDDLALANALRSPLFGWSEAQLYQLAQGRRGYLWESLRHSPLKTAKATLDILYDLRNHTDFLRPYELIERLLMRHKGRQRFVKRLGQEVEDGIDELLNQALLYEQKDVPSLTGFLAWLEEGNVEIKRQLNNERGQIRVMTVHGAKGLEGNIVILPDTTNQQNLERGNILALGNGAHSWKTDSSNSPTLIIEAHERGKEKEAQEKARLLYVALTRARSWLIIAGTGDAATETRNGRKPPQDWCWYRHIEAGLKSLNIKEGADGNLVYSRGMWPENASSEGWEPDDQSQAVKLPEWAFYKATRAENQGKVEWLLPSDLGGEKSIQKKTGTKEHAAPQHTQTPATERGTLIHQLLEQLPKAAKEQWPSITKRIAFGYPDISDLLSEAMRVLLDPNLAFLFAPNSLSETPLTAPIGKKRLLGTIDKLVIWPDRIMAVDYKTNSEIPTKIDDVPEGLLRQMGAYHNALSQIYPQHKIETAILWTSTAQLMPLESDYVIAALERST